MSDDKTNDAPTPATAEDREDRDAIVARRRLLVDATLRAPVTPRPPTGAPQASPMPCLSIASGHPMEPVAPAGFELPPPPPDDARPARLALGALAPITAVGAFVLGVPELSLVSVAFAALCALTVRGRRETVGQSLAMAALDRAARGRFDEARALLDAVAPPRHFSHLGQVVDSQRAALALYEGDLEAAEAFATEAAREGARLGMLGELHRGSALSLRAVARAALGKKDDSLSDVAKLRGSSFRQGSFVARAALAEALLFARERDLESLSRVLRDERALLFGATGPRERMVARALARMVAARRVSVYREPGKRDEEPLSEQASWVARLAPDAAAYANTATLGAPQPAPARLDPDVIARAEKGAPKPRSRRARLLAVAGLLLLGFSALLVLVRARGPALEPAPIEPAPILPLTVALPVLAGLVGVIAYRYLRSKRRVADLSAAGELRLRGLHEEARAVLAPLVRDKGLLVAPQAHRELAAIANATGDPREAAAQAEAGIRGVHVSETSRTLARPVLLPQLYGELAAALAAEGRVARAEEELDRVRALHADYPFLARDTFRVRLVGLAATGRLDEAAELARSRPVDLFLSMHEELLCDALRVHAGDRLPEGERERVELEVGEEPRGGFLARVAPALHAELPRRGARVVVAEEPPPSSGLADDQEVEESEPPERAQTR